MGIGKDVGKQAAETIVNALPSLEKTVQDVAAETTLNAADAVSDIVGAADRLTAMLRLQSAGWLQKADALTAELKRFNDTLELLCKGVSITPKG